MSLLDSFPLSLFVVLALTLGLAPFVPEPHLFEKVRMLVQGQLAKPIDIFDLVMHLTPFILLALKLVREFMLRQG